MSITPVPASVVRPGEFLEREIAARGWTQKDVANILGRPLSTINEIARGVKQITPETALQFEAVFDIRAQVWLNLEMNYRLWLAQEQQVTQPSVQRKSALYRSAPIAEMLKRGWIKGSSSLDELESEMHTFQAIPVGAVSCRSSAPEGMEQAALEAWQRRVTQVVRKRPLPKFNRDLLTDAMHEILHFARRVQDVAKVPVLLAKAGVHFIIVGHLSHTYLDGAAFLVGENPVVALTLRFDRIDSFWFTLLHELAHILLDHRGTYYVYLEKTDRSMEEEAADRTARNWLIPQREYQQFVTQTRPFFSKARVEKFAMSIHRHPGIVVGRLQFDKHVDYKNMRALLVSVKAYLSAWTDDALLAT